MCQGPEQDGAFVGGKPCRRGVYKSDKVVVMVRGGRSLGHSRQRETRAGPQKASCRGFPATGTGDAGVVEGRRPMRLVCGTPKPGSMENLRGKRPQFQMQKNNHSLP